MSKKTTQTEDGLVFERPMTLPKLEPVSQAPIADPSGALDRLLAPMYTDTPEVVLRARLDDLIDHRDDGVQLSDLFAGVAL